MLTKGDSAPLDLEMIDDEGKSTTLRAFLGSWVVVYFYPRDLTPGCTIEAEQFRDNQSAFEKLGTRVLGVSKDTCASHQKFKQKKDLAFTLIADEKHALMEAFGVWGEKKFMGRTYMGTSRTTFLVDPHGQVMHVWDRVKPLGHAGEVLVVLAELQA